MSDFTTNDGVPASAGYPSEDYGDNLTTSRLNISKRIVEITANPKPSYSVNGQTVQWSAYLRMLIDKLDTIDLLVEKDNAPFEIVSQGFT
jgi:hypothetical protein